MSQFKVSNTTVDHSDLFNPLQTLLSLAGVNISLDLSAAADASDVNLVPENIQLGQLTGINLNLTDGANVQKLLMNKESGAANGTVAAALQQQFGLHVVGDSVALKFFYSGAPLTAGGSVQLASNDTSVTVVPSPLILFSATAGPPARTGGLVFVTLRATSVTAGSETVTFRLATVYGA